MTACFPLLRLSNKDQRNVFQHLGTFDLFAFSLCSKVTKTKIIALNRKIQGIDIEASSRNYIELRPVSEESVRLVFKKRNIKTVRRNAKYYKLAKTVLSVRGRLEISKYWIQRRFGIRDWINHIMEIFNHPAIFMFQIVEHDAQPVPDLEEMCDAINGMKFCNVQTERCTEKTISYLRNNFPLRQLTFKLPLGPNIPQKSIQTILVGNIERVVFLQEDSRRDITLNSLLSVNCTYLTITASSLTFKEINLFFKHYINNVKWKLKRAMFAADSWDMAVVLKNINYTVYLTRKLQGLKNPELYSEHFVEIQRSDLSKLCVGLVGCRYGIMLSIGVLGN